MMNNYRFQLEPYKTMKTRYYCPAPHCGREKTFSRYIDNETQSHLHNNVGRCNREIKCGYHYTPKQYFQDNKLHRNYSNSIPLKSRFTQPISIPVSFIDSKVFKASLKGYETNQLVNFLIQRFGYKITKEMISRYFIASSKYWPGSTVFWQIDAQGRLRTGKIMLYDSRSGKRVKKPRNHIYWVHKALNNSVFELSQCLFGEHLLKDRTRPVAVVESEKTAVIASAYLPQFIWVATGGLSNLSKEKCSILKGRNVTLFPDLNGFEKWNDKAKELSLIASVTVSNLLELKATDMEKKQGLDLADYLVRYNLNRF
ncbi:MAG: hypothetical protein ACI9JN_002478 [Bacteroidia bacterium]|jgi:hypothetical protein